MNAVELAREGKNTACVDCSSQPLFGGLRCLRCFQNLAQQRAGVHEFAEPPSYGTYVAGCRCRRCRNASAADQRRRRARPSSPLTRVVTEHVCEKHPQPVHACYIKHRCRCSGCRQINADYHRAWSSSRKRSA